MSKYTTEVRYICENVLNLEHSEGQLSVNQIVQQAAPLIFDFDFPIFDEAYRPTLCTKILKHFYTREIGEETVGLWKLRLDTKLNEIMPYYNKLYLSGVREFNPLFDVDLTTEHEGKGTNDVDRNEDMLQTNNSNSTGNSSTTTDEVGRSNLKQDETSTTDSSQDQSGDTTSTTEEVNTQSDFPQGGLDGVLSDDYLSKATKNNVTTSGETSYKTENLSTTVNNSSGTNDYNSTTNVNQENTQETKANSTVKRGSEEMAKSTQEYVTKMFGTHGGDWKGRIEAITLIAEIENIDIKIIRELESLFMNIW